MHRSCAHRMPQRFYYLPRTSEIRHCWCIRMSTPIFVRVKLTPENPHMSERNSLAELGQRPLPADIPNAPNSGVRAGHARPKESSRPHQVERPRVPRLCVARCFGPCADSGRRRPLAQAAPVSLQAHARSANPLRREGVSDHRLVNVPAKGMRENPLKLHCSATFSQFLTFCALH